MHIHPILIDPLGALPEGDFTTTEPVNAGSAGERSPLQYSAAGTWISTEASRFFAYKVGVDTAASGLGERTLSGYFLRTVSSVSSSHKLLTLTGCA